MGTPTQGDIFLMNEDEQHRLFQLQKFKTLAYNHMQGSIAAAKDSKAAYAEACAAVDAYLSEFRSGKMPLFDKQEPTCKEVRICDAYSDGGYVLGDQEDRWKFVPVAELLRHGCTSGDVTKLLQVNIQTLGAIVDYTTDGNRRLGDIKGVGSKTADRITNALINYHQSNPQVLMSTQEDTEIEYREFVDKEDSEE